MPRALSIAAAVLAALALLAPPALAGSPADPEITDECGLSEEAGTALVSAPPPGWADVCSGWFSAAVDDDGVLESLSVTIDLAEDVEDRPVGTTYAVGWLAGRCSDAVRVEDAGGPLGSRIVALDSRCDDVSGPCTGIWALITEITGGACGQTEMGPTARTTLPASAVTQAGDRVSVRIDVDVLPPDVAARYRVGAVLANTYALTLSKVGTARGALVEDSDGAYALHDWVVRGESYTIGS